MTTGNMDDQYEQMGRFTGALIEFNLRLRASLDEMQKRHDVVSPLWQDEMRRHYDAQWQPFHAMVAHYDKVEGPSYVEFLEIQRHHLATYLFGGD